MPSLPSGRRRKRPGNKTRYKKDGSIDWKARVPFYGWDPEYAKMYNTTRWRKIRDIILQRTPTCPICMHEDKLTPAAEVDHVQPHRGDPHLFHSLDNLWGLCTDHHRIKTAMESNGSSWTTKKDWLEAILNFNA